MADKNRVSVVRRADGRVLIESAYWCASYLCKLQGLQFRRRLGPDEALIIVHAADSVVQSSIHMFFVFFPIAAVWINSQGRVTSAQLAKPWRPFYASPEPARYVLETDPALLDIVSEGDYLDFEAAQALRNTGASV